MYASGTCKKLLKTSEWVYRQSSWIRQYGRRLCIRIDGVQWAMAENETSNNVLPNVKSIIEESNSEIPKVTTDMTYWIGKAYTDKTSGLKCKYIIVRFTIFQHRTMFYYKRKNLKHSLKIKLNLTKTRYSIFTEAMQLVKNNEVVKFVIADINCCLKVVFKDGNCLFLVIVAIYVVIIGATIVRRSSGKVKCLCRSLFLIRLQVQAFRFRATTLLKTDPSTGVFLWLLWNRWGAFLRSTSGGIVFLKFHYLNSDFK